MRLLLLLSAIFAALTGAMAPRASAAQPVAASAPAQAARAERVAAVAVPVSAGADRPRPASRPSLPDMAAPAPRAPLYADRLRE